MAAIIFSVSKLVRLVLIGACMIYFLHLHHVTSRYVKRVTLLGQRFDETQLWRFGSQFYSTPLQKMERGIVIQQSNVLGRSPRIRISIERVLDV